MRGISIAAIALVLLLVTSVSLSAQMNTEEIPGAFVTGTVVDDTATEQEGTVVYKQTVEWSDARLPSTVRVEGA